MIRLSCADNTFRLLQPWESAVELIRLLELEAVDVCLMGNRSHIRPEDVRDDIPAAAARITAGLAERGLTCSPSQANFLLVRVNDPAPARERLARGGILVRDGAGIGFPGHLRIALGTRDVNERVLKLLED